MIQILTSHKTQPFDRLKRKDFLKLRICPFTSPLKDDKAYWKVVNIGPKSELCGFLVSNSNKKEVHHGRIKIKLAGKGNL